MENNNERPTEDKDGKKWLSWLNLNSGIVKYLRELSIVIIGVLTTFLISDRITDYNRQQEIDGMIKSVKAEMEENLKDLQWVQERWQGERYIFKLMEENRDNIYLIPGDTLNKYFYAIGALHNLNIKSESYELLKSSVLIQYVKDKELLSDISKLYKSLYSLDMQLSTYSSQKRNHFLNPLIENMDDEELRKWNEDTSLEYAAFISQKKEFRKFILLSETILSPPDIFENRRKRIIHTIAMLEKKGY